MPENWITFRVEFGLVNNDKNYVAPRFPAENVQLYARFAETKSPETPYLVTPITVTGASNARVREIVFQARLPIHFQIRGEYQNDRLLTYCFESKIPRFATPTYYSIPRYGKIDYALFNWTSAFNGYTKFRQPCEQISIGDPFYFSACNFKRDDNFHPAHDLITADLFIVSADPTRDTAVKLKYYPLTESGIVGAAYTDTLNCKPLLTVGPYVGKPSRICAIVPKGATNIKMIFTGDVNDIYDTGL